MPSDSTTSNQGFVGNSSDIGNSRDFFRQLIATAPAEDLRVALLATTKEHFKRVAATKLLTDLRVGRARTDAEAAGANKRRLMQTCAGCGSEYDEAKNIGGSCHYYSRHPGNAELNDDDEFWADDDLLPEEHGFDDFPETYLFSCCKQDGTSRGCERGMHVASIQQPESKSRRV